MKDTFYFSHDYNARNDSKIKKLLSKHGFIGYGLFWAIIEDLYNNANALPTDYDSIAFDLRTDKNVIKSIVLDFDLFVVNEDYFGSTSVQRRLEERNEKSATARKSAFKRWEKMRTHSEGNANALQSESEGNAIKESKENEIKDKKERINTIISFLNEQAKSNFSPKAKGHATHINARLNEGRSIEDFKLVIKDRCDRWLNNPQMSEYLRPETLFGSKFDGYLSEALKAGTKTETQSVNDEIDKHPLILQLTPLVRSQMSLRDKQDYINSKTPQNA